AYGTLPEPMSADAAERARQAAANARTFLEQCGGTTTGMLNFAEKTRSSYAELGKKTDLSLEEFEKAFDAEKTKQAGNPVFNAFFPALVKVRKAKARYDVRRALLSAALAVQVEGREALKDHPDPVIGGSFDYAPFDGGFELRSKLK